MSTYAVFGMTRPRAKEMAKKAVNRDLDRTGENIPESAWLERVAKREEEIMSNGKSVMLSEKFDAPQFAEEFRDLAKNLEHRDLEIRAHVKLTGEYTPSGKQKMAWQVAGR